MRVHARADLPGETSPAAYTFALPEMTPEHAPVMMIVRVAEPVAPTMPLDPELERRLAEAAERSRRTRSEFRDALRRQLAIARLEDHRRRIMPFAGAGRRRRSRTSW